MTRAFAIAVNACAAALAVATWSAPAGAHDPGHDPQVTACLKALHNKAGEQCCSGDDAEKVVLEWNVQKGKYVVTLKNPVSGEVGEYEIPDEALVQAGKCGIAAAMLWWHPTYEHIDRQSRMKPVIRCFSVAPGG